MSPRDAVAPPVDLERFVPSFLRRRRIPGLALGLVRGGRRALARGWGYRDRAARLPATERTVFGIASMTKSFTALAILRLEEDGALRVDDPVVRHLPEFRTPAPRWTRKVTLGHLLSHSSGLPPLPSIYYTSARSVRRDPPYDPRVARRVGIDPDHRPIDTYEQLLDYLATEHYRWLGPPGGQFSYSNEGFGLLGAVIERASGRTYESFLEEAIFRPAGMTRTTFDSGIMFRAPEVTTLYAPHRTRRGGPLVASDEWWEDSCMRAAGAIRTNVDDLLRYLAIYLDGGRVGRERVVGPKSVRTMLTPRIEVRPGVSYGLGIAVRPDYHGRLLAFHGGGLKGVSSEFAVVPDARAGGVVLSNVELAPVESLLEVGLNGLLGLPATTPFFEPPPRSARPASLAVFGGWYCSGEGIWVRVTPRAHDLRLDFLGIEVTARNLRLVPHGGDGFLLRSGGRTGWVRFERGPSGRVEAMAQGWRLLRRRRPSELPLARAGRMVW